MLLVEPRVTMDFSPHSDHLSLPRVTVTNPQGKVLYEVMRPTDIWLISDDSDIWLVGIGHHPASDGFLVCRTRVEK